jgi:hypothetical protein
VLSLTPLQFVHLFCNQSKCILLFFSCISVNLLNLFGIRRNCLRSERSQSLNLCKRRVMKQIVVIIEAYHFCQQHTKIYPTPCCQG